MRSWMIGVAAAAAMAAPVQATTYVGTNGIFTGSATRGLTLFSQLNLFTKGDAKVSSDVEGKVFVGGNVVASNSGATWDVGAGRVTGTGAKKSGLATITVVGNNQLPASGLGLMAGGKNGSRGAVLDQYNSSGQKVTGNPDIRIGGNTTRLKLNPSATSTIVGGNVNWTDSGGNASDKGAANTVRYGGTASGFANLQNAGAKPTFDATLTKTTNGGLQRSLQNERDQDYADLLTLSSALAALKPGTSTGSTVTLSDAMRPVVNFSDLGGYSVLNVYGGSTSWLFSTQNADRLTFNPITSGGSTVPMIVNIFSGSYNGATGLYTANAANSNYNWLWNPGTLSSYGQNIIWNFVDATTVNGNGKNIFGSILAPTANVINSGQIDGAVAAYAWDQQGRELHLGTFDTDLAPKLVTKLSPPPVPEPATWATMLIGFGVVGGAVRRRRRGAQLAA